MGRTSRTLLVLGVFTLAMATMPRAVSSNLLAAQPSLNVEPVLLTGEHQAARSENRRHYLVGSAKAQVLVTQDEQFADLSAFLVTCQHNSCEVGEQISWSALESAHGISAPGADDLTWLTGRGPTGDDRSPDDWNLFLGRDDHFEALPFPVNTPFSECCVATVDAANFLFSSDRAGTWDIYQATHSNDQWQVQRLGEPLSSEPRADLPSSQFGEWPSFVTPKWLLFSSIRPGGIGGDDLYLACGNLADGFGSPILLPRPINSDGFEDSPSYRGAENRLYWSSDRDGLNRAHTVEIDLDRLCEEG